MNVWLKRIGIGLGVLVGLVLLTAGGAYTYGGMLGSRTLSVLGTFEALDPATVDSATIARGEHLATAIGKCVECHGPDLGGTPFIDDPSMGRVPAPNLTTGKGGVLARYNDAQLERAIRHGLRADGTPLLIMPSKSYQYFADEDVAAIITYLRSLPAVDREFPKKELKFLSRALTSAGLIKYDYDVIDHERAQPARMEPAATPEYGRYLAEVGGCTGCHGPGLSGGSEPGSPPEFKPASNLTPTGIGTWTEADFFRALREGIRPGGTPIDTQMPWRLTRKMTDEEIRAVFAFLKTVPAKEFGNR